MVDQHGALRVKLSDLIEGMDFQSDEQSSFLNLTTAGSRRHHRRGMTGG